MPASTTSASLPAAPSRFTLIDPLRIVASFFVAWVHVREGKAFLGLGFGLFTFFLVMVALASRRRASEPLWDFAGRKARYLIVPWLRWSALYGLLQLAWDLAQGESPLARLSPWMLLYGTRGELWFLPFALATLVCVRSVQRWLFRVAPAPAVAACAAVGVLVLAVCDRLERGVMPMPVDEWYGVLPAIPLGLAIGNALRLATRARVAALAALALVVVGGTLGNPLPAGEENLWPRYAIAGCLVALGFAWRPRIPDAVGTLALSTYGVYLAHPLVQTVARLVPGVTALPAAVHVGIVWVLSAALVALLGRTRLTWAELPGRGTGARVERLEPSRRAAA